MSDNQKTPRRKDIRRRYATMAPGAIDAELERFGIDPQPTIDAVTKLVHDALRDVHARRSLHTEETAPLKTLSPIPLSLSVPAVSLFPLEQ